MPKSRQISNIVRFTPPGVLTGVGQLVDVWGNASADVHPPRIKYVVKVSSRPVPFSGSYGIKSALCGDVRKIGNDIFHGVKKHTKKNAKGI